MLPHPHTIGRSREEIARDFVTVVIDRCPEVRWHFKTAVHRSSRLGPQGNVAPTPRHPMQTLALFGRIEPVCDIEVFGFLMPREFHPSDWLDLYLENQKIGVESRKPIPMSVASGVAGDCVGTWEVAEGEYAGPFAGRFVALKWDDRLFLLALRAPRDVYPEVAEDFFLAMANFQPAHPENPLPFAQRMVQVSGTAPVAWQTQIPDSWSVRADPISYTGESSARVSAFQAQCRTLENTPDRGAFGHLTFAMAARSLASDPKDAAQKYVEASVESGAVFENTWFQKEPAPPGFRSAHVFISPGKLTLQPDGRQIDAEFRCRVLEHEHAWFTAGLTGPRREVAPVAWMHNKRSLDLLTQLVEFPA